MVMGWFSLLKCHHTTIWITAVTLFKSHLAVKYHTITSTVILQEVCMSLSLHIHQKSTNWLTRGVNSVVTLHSKQKVWHESNYCLDSRQMSDGAGAHNFIWQLTYFFTQTIVYDGRQSSVHCYSNVLWVRGSHVSVPCGAVYTKFSFTIFKKGVRNISPQLEGMLHVSHMFIAHPCFLFLVNH
jgi:hypothetical protein